jgi:hypothetical protein
VEYDEDSRDVLDGGGTREGGWLGDDLLISSKSDPGGVLPCVPPGEEGRSDPVGMGGARLERATSCL